MLTYQCDDFIEMEEGNVVALRRAASPLSFSVSRGINFELLAFLVVQRSGNHTLGQVAFYSKNLKRALVFRIEGDQEVDELVATGQKALESLEFKLEEVQIQFSAAMRQVVLSAIPAFKNPAALRQFREERAKRLKELQEVAGATPREESGEEYGWTREAIHTAQLDLAKEQGRDENFRKLGQILLGRLESIGLSSEELLARHTEMREKLAALEDELGGTQRALADEQQEGKELAGQLAAAQKQRQAAEEKLELLTKSAADESARVDKDLKNLEGQFKKAETALAKAEGEAADAKQRESDLQRQVTSLEQKLEKAEKAQSASGKETSEAKKQVEELRQQVAKLEIQLKQALGAQTSAEQEAAAVGKQGEELKRQVSDLEMQLKQATGAEATAGKAAASARQREEDLRKQLSELEARLKQSESDGKRVKDEQNKLADAVGLVDKLKSEVADQVGELESLRQELASSRADAETGSAEIRQLKRKLQDTETRGKQAEEESAALRQELELVERRFGEALTESERLVRQLAEAKQEMLRLEKAAIRGAAASTGSAAAKASEEVLDKLSADLRRAEDEADRLRKEAKGVQAELQAARQTILQLEQQVKTAATVGSDPVSGEAEARVVELQQRLAETEQLLDKERHAREAAEKKPAVVQSPPDQGAAKAKEQVLELMKRLAEVEQDLQKERKAREAAEKESSFDRAEVRELKQTIESLKKGTDDSGRVSRGRSTAEPPRKEAASSAPAPHELRKPPRPGSFFHVDWDLAGLPCQTVDAVTEAWESVFNVNLSMEGYPMQYVTVRLAILREGRNKSLYMLFHLNQEKRNLIYVPAKPPKDAAGLRTALTEAKRFLQVTGVDIDKIAPEDMPAKLDSYLAA